MPNPREIDEIIWYVRAALAGLYDDHPSAEELIVALEILGADKQKDDTNDRT